MIPYTSGPVGHCHCVSVGDTVLTFSHPFPSADARDSHSASAQGHSWEGRSEEGACGDVGLEMSPTVPNRLHLGRLPASLACPAALWLLVCPCHESGPHSPLSWTECPATEATERPQRPVPELASGEDAAWSEDGSDSEHRAFKCRRISGRLLRGQK